MTISKISRDNSFPLNPFKGPNFGPFSNSAQHTFFRPIQIALIWALLPTFPTAHFLSQISHNPVSPDPTRFIVLKEPRSVKYSTLIHCLSFKVPCQSNVWSSKSITRRCPWWSKMEPRSASNTSNPSQPSVPPSFFEDEPKFRKRVFAYLGNCFWILKF